MKFRLNRNDKKQQETLTLKVTSARRRLRKQAKAPKWVHQAKRIGDKLPRLKHQRNRKLVRRLTIPLTSFTVVTGHGLPDFTAESFQNGDGHNGC